MKTVYLCGFMGCGKSTVGKALAAALCVPFTDMDAYITEKSGMSIPEIFAEKGERYFRELESEAMLELGEKGGVTACGGGALLRPKNADIASKCGIAVYLSLPFDSCYERIKGDKNRPIVAVNTKDELEAVYNERVPVYKEHSGVEISAEGAPAEVAEKILSVLEAVYGKNFLC